LLESRIEKDPHLRLVDCLWRSHGQAQLGVGGAAGVELFNIFANASNLTGDKMADGRSEFDIAQIISPETGHVKLPLSRLEGARVLWINPRAQTEDPSYRALGDRAGYERHLLETCAFTIAGAGAGTSDTFGIADCYGGAGIGTNGGSGRAVYVNGYHVKGVGRTPLVGLDNDASHSSGGAYLEECVRESIFAEIVNLEFPHGSVPTLAIIDTGREVIWETEHGPKRERMCLLVRPMFLRPAHIERAVRYKSGNEYGGAADAARVRATALAIERQVGGAAAMDDLLSTCLERWAQQIAYSYVSRLSHGGVTSSNVAIDGRLVDFGAMTAVPTFGRYWVSSAVHPTGLQHKDILSTVTGISSSMAFILGDVARAKEWRTGVFPLVAEAYFRQVHEGFLGIAGLSGSELKDLRGCEDYAKIRDAVHAMMLEELSHQYIVFGGMPNTPETSITVRRLIELRTWARSACNAPGGGGAVARGDTAATGDSELDTSSIAQALAPRAGLERDAIKNICYDRLDGQGLSGDDLCAATASLIQEVVLSESRVGPDRAHRAVDR
jgi:protein adenylyltransferase SelO-like protein